MKAWLRVSITVEPEIAESLAELFSRFAEGGVVIESTQIQHDPNSPGTVSGPLHVFAFIENGPDLDEKRLAIEQSLAALRLIQPIPEPKFDTIQEENWMAAWKEHFHPIQIGRSIQIQPAWLPATDQQRHIIRIEPGMAFGTGAHPTTQLSLLMLEDYLQAGDSLIDVGCGSGILSLAAEKMGALPVLGVDIDPQAIQNARHNAELNNSQAIFEQATVADLLAANLYQSSADLLIANILAPILITLLNEGLGKLVRPKGTLLLSGILEEQKSAILSALGDANFESIEIRTMGDWLAIAAKSASPS